MANSGGFRPGVSGNPGGRSRKYAAMSRRILELSNDGEELVAFLFDVMRDVEAELKMRVHCAEVLLDRGLGKPVQAMDLNVVTPGSSLQALSDDELLELAGVSDEA